MYSAPASLQVTAFFRSRFTGRIQLLSALFASMFAPCCPLLASDVTASTRTTLTVSSSETREGQVATGALVTLAASVTAGGSLVTTGQVRFCDTSAPLCWDIHLLGTAQLTSRGTAVVHLRPGSGTHGYRAVFLGTRTLGASMSDSARLVVAGAYPTTTSIAKDVA